MSRHWLSQLSRRAESVLNNATLKTGNKRRKQNVNNFHKRSKTDKDDLSDLTQYYYPAKSIPKCPRFKRKLKSPQSNRYLPDQTRSTPDRYRSNFERLYTSSDRYRSSPERIRKSDRNKTGDAGRSPDRRRSSPGRTNNRISRSDTIKFISKSDGNSRSPSPLYRILDKCRREKRTHIDENVLDEIYSDYEKKKITKEETFKTKYRKLVVENAKLKNELSVVNREVKQLLEQLQTIAKERQLLQALQGKFAVTAQKLWHIENEWTEKMKKLEDEVGNLRQNKTLYEERIRFLETMKEKETLKTLKIENDLHHAELTIEDLQIREQKYQNECKRLKRDWTEYKLYVNGLLSDKDRQIELIKANDITKKTKNIFHVPEQFKKQRDDLIIAKSILVQECNCLSETIRKLQLRSATTERLFNGLREALNNERKEKQKSEKTCATLVEKLKELEASNEVITKLQETLRNKEEELFKVYNILNRPKAYAYTETEDVLREDTGTNIQDIINEYAQTQEPWELLSDKSSLNIELSALQVSMPPSSKFLFQSKGTRKDMCEMLPAAGQLKNFTDIL